MRKPVPTPTPAVTWGWALQGHPAPTPGQDHGKGCPQGIHAEGPAATLQYSPTLRQEQGGTQQHGAKPQDRGLCPMLDPAGVQTARGHGQGAGSGPASQGAPCFSHCTERHRVTKGTAAGSPSGGGQRPGREDGQAALGRAAELEARPPAWWRQSPQPRPSLNCPYTRP